MIYYFLFNITVCYLPSSRNYILLLNLQRNQTRECGFGKWELFCLTSVFQHQVDKDRHRISLGMKNSYFRDDDGEDIQTTSRQSINKTDKGNNVLIGTHSTVFPESSSADIDVSVVNTTDNILTEVESRASIPPLEVPLDDIENSDIDDAVNKNPDHTGGADTTDEKDKKRAMKKAKKER